VDSYGEVLPKITRIAGQLDAARAFVAAIPRPNTEDPDKLPWQHTNAARAEAIASGTAAVRQLETLLALQQKITLQHVIDLVSCIPEDQGNYLVLREAERYLLALSEIQEATA
jgi:hypothetical protein